LLYTTIGSTTAILRAGARVVNNDATYYGDRFNYYTALVGSVVPFQVTYTLTSGTWDTNIFDRAFNYTAVGWVDFAQPISAPQLQSLTINGSAQVPSQATVQFRATAAFDGGVLRDVTNAAAWSVEPAALASISQGQLTTQAIAGNQETLTLHAVYSAGGASAQADKTIIVKQGGSADEALGWEMYQGDPKHTGFVPITLNPDVFSLRWQRAIGSGIMLASPSSHRGGLVVFRFLACGVVVAFAVPYSRAQEPSQEERINRLLDTLKSGQLEDQKKAAHGLWDAIYYKGIGTLRAKDVVDALVEGLNHKDEYVRSYVRDALLYVRDEAALPVYLKWLDDPSPSMRSFGAGGLYNLGPKAKDAIPVLTAKIKDGKVFNFEALAKIAGKDAVPAVLDAVARHKLDDHATFRAVQVFTEYPDPRATDFMGKLHDSGKYRVWTTQFFAASADGAADRAAAQVPDGLPRRPQGRSARATNSRRGRHPRYRGGGSRQGEGQGVVRRDPQDGQRRPVDPRARGRGGRDGPLRARSSRPTDCDSISLTTLRSAKTRSLRSSGWLTTRCVTTAG
jgi:hypothetical protein